MAWTPIGTKHQHAVSSIVLTLEDDVPAGASLIVNVGAAGHVNYPITAQESTLGYMSGGATGFYTGSNQCQRLFAIDCPSGLSSGDTVTINMSNAGQGSTTIMWADAFYVPDATVSGLEF